MDTHRERTQHASLEAEVLRLGHRVTSEPHAALAALETILHRAEQANAQRAAAWASLHVARVDQHLGAHREAMRRGRVAYERLHALADLDGELKAINLLGKSWTMLGDQQRAGAVFRDGLERARQSDNRPMQGVFLTNLAMLHGLDEDAERYVALTRQAVDLFRALDDRGRLALSLANLGGGLARLNAHTDSAAAHHEALTLARAQGDRRTEAIALNGLSENHASEGRFEDAMALRSQALTLLQDLDARYDIARSSTTLVKLLHLSGRDDEAIALAEETCASPETAPFLRERQRLLELLGTLYEARGALDQALRVTRQLVSVVQGIHRAAADADAPDGDTPVTATGHTPEVAAENRRLRSALAAANRERHSLTIQATTDPLTGLLNRRAFESLVEVELERAAASRQPVGLLLLDLDHFKQVNDTYGHTVGDEVLIEFAARLRSSTRGMDVIGRIGGEEFAVLIQPAADGLAERVAARLAQKVRATPFETSAGRIAVTVSVGVGTFEGPVALDDAKQRVDVALYTAKRRGRDLVMCAD